MIRAVAFDLLGVLLDFRKPQLTPLQTEMAHTFGVIPADYDFVSHFAKKSGLSEEEVVEEIQLVISHIYALRQPDLFSHLPKMKYAVASNHLSYMGDWIKSLPIGQNFDFFFTSGDRGLVKPSAAYYYALARELEEPPINILFIDDTPSNCAGADAVGMKAVLFEPGMCLSDVVLDNL